MSDTPRGGVSVFVGGVSELFQGDLDLGRRAAQILSAEAFGDHVVVEDLHYGAVGVVHRLRDLEPTTMILVGATQRGREPGTVERRRVHDPALTVEQTQAAVGDAVVGYISVDLIVEVAAGLDVLPPRTVLVDVEPFSIDPSDQLSRGGERSLEEALNLARTEIRRTPLLELTDRVRERLGGDRLEPSPALEALHGLLLELERLDRDGSWGSAFPLRDRLKQRIARGETGEGMDHLDWGLWWGLMEEMDRLQQIDAVEDFA